MSLRYLSVCSGIEAATQAWHPLGWQPVAFSEIEAFPSAVLAHHYPTVPNWGDMTKFLGNSWAVNVAEWVGERINEVDGWAMEAASCPRARKASRTVPENSQATSTLIAPAPVTAAAASSGSRRGRTQPSQAIRASRF